MFDSLFINVLYINVSSIYFGYILKRKNGMKIPKDSDFFYEHFFLQNIEWITYLYTTFFPGTAISFVTIFPIRKIPYTLPPTPIQNPILNEVLSGTEERVVPHRGTSPPAPGNPAFPVVYTLLSNQNRTEIRKVNLLLNDLLFNKKNEIILQQRWGSSDFKGDYYFLNSYEIPMLMHYVKEGYLSPSCCKLSDLSEDTNPIILYYSYKH